MSSHWISETKREAIYESDGRRCIYCGAPEGEGTESLTLDHLFPQKLGGGHEAWNLATCCLSCNSAKQETSVDKFLRQLERAGHPASEIRHRIRLAVRRHQRIETAMPVRTRRTRRV